VSTENPIDGRGTRRASSFVVAAVAVAVVLAVTTILVSNHNSSQQRARRNAAAAYLAGPSARAARAAAIAETRATLTYNYKTLAADFAAAEKGLTTRFAQNYALTTAASVTPLAKKYHAVSQAAVTGAGVSAATDASATVLLFVDQTVTNSQIPHPRLDRSRIEASMVRVNGRWLINGMTPI